MNFIEHVYNTPLPNVNITENTYNILYHLYVKITDHKSFKPIIQDVNNKANELEYFKLIPFEHFDTFTLKFKSDRNTV